MTFFLVRAGLPNSVAILALAMVPLVSLALAALPERIDTAHYGSPTMMLVAAIDTVADGAPTPLPNKKEPSDPTAVPFD